MRMQDVYPSKYYKPDEVPEAGLILTIASVGCEIFKSQDGTGDETKPVVHFAEAGSKMMIVNRTNWKTIAEQCGPDSDDWTGQKIKMIVLPVDAFGKTMDAIRVQPRRKTAPVVTRPAAPVATATVAPAQPRATTRAVVVAEATGPELDESVWDQVVGEGETIEF